MIEAFNTGADIHRITASQVFGVPEDMVTPLMRSHAKAVNFGIVYGIGAHSLSQDIHVSYADAKTYIEEYLRHYGAVAGFMDRLIEQAKDSGYATVSYTHLHLDSPDIRDGVRNKLAAGRDSAYLSRELGTICCEAPVETDMDAYVVRAVQREELSRLMARLSGESR